MIPYQGNWNLWRERNRVAFENETPSVDRMKPLFLSSLWSWAKMYSVDNINSLIDFLLGWGVGELMGCL